MLTMCPNCRHRFPVPGCCNPGPGGHQAPAAPAAPDCTYYGSVLVPRGHTGGGCFINAPTIIQGPAIIHSGASIGHPGDIKSSRLQYQPTMQINTTCDLTGGTVTITTPSIQSGGCLIQSTDSGYLFQAPTIEIRPNFSGGGCLVQTRLSTNFSDNLPHLKYFGQPIVTNVAENLANPPSGCQELPGMRNNGAQKCCCSNRNASENSHCNNSGNNSGTSSGNNSGIDSWNIFEASSANDFETSSGNKFGTSSENNFGTSSGNSFGTSSGNSPEICSGNNLSASSGNDSRICSGNNLGASSGNNSGICCGNNFGTSSGNNFGTSSGNNFGTSSENNFGNNSGIGFGTIPGTAVGSNSGISFSTELDTKSIQVTEVQSKGIEIHVNTLVQLPKNGGHCTVNITTTQANAVGSASSGSPASVRVKHNFNGGGLVEAAEAPAEAERREETPTTPLSWLTLFPLYDGMTDKTCAKMQDVKRLLRSTGWYHEGISWLQSEQLLKYADVGRWFLRDSSDQRYVFAVSVQTNRGPTSVRILYAFGRFRLDAEPSIAHAMPTFDCPIKMLEYYIEYSRKMEVNQRHVWVDFSGLLFSHIYLTEPVVRQVSALSHLARLAIDRTRVDWTHLPAPVKECINEYPYAF